MAATDEVRAEEVDWSAVDQSPPGARPPRQTREDRRNIILAELAGVHATKVSLEAREVDLIRSAKSNEATWKEIGDAIGSSRQTAHRAYAHLVE